MLFFVQAEDTRVQKAIEQILVEHSDILNRKAEGTQFDAVLLNLCGRHSGLMVSALDSGASGPGSSPGRGHCVVFLGKTLYSRGASLHSGV